MYWRNSDKNLHWILELTILEIDRNLKSVNRKSNSYTSRIEIDLLGRYLRYLSTPWYCLSCSVSSENWKKFPVSRGTFGTEPSKLEKIKLENCSFYIIYHCLKLGKLKIVTFYLIHCLKLGNLKIVTFYHTHCLKLGNLKMVTFYLTLHCLKLGNLKNKTWKSLLFIALT